MLACICIMPVQCSEQLSANLIMAMRSVLMERRAITTLAAAAPGILRGCL